MEVVSNPINSIINQSFVVVICGAYFTYRPAGSYEMKYSISTYSTGKGGVVPRNAVAVPILSIPSVLIMEN